MPVFRPGSVTKKVAKFGNTNANHGPVLVGSGYQVSFLSSFIQFLSLEVSVIKRKRLNRSLFWLLAFLNMLNACQHFGLSEHA